MPILNTGEIRPTADSVTSSARLDFETTGAATSNRSTSIGASDFSLVFDSRVGQYNLVDASNMASFGAAQLTKETSVPDFFPRVEFQRHGAAADDYLVIFKAPNATPPVNARYGAYGAWQHNDQGAATTRVRLQYFTYGSPTPIGAMPHTGIIKFRITGTGNFADDSRLFFAQTDTVITVDFGTGTVSGNLILTGADFFGDNFGGLVGVQLPGTIAGNFVDAPIGSTIATLSGRFHLQFLGPNADELELTYEGSNDREGFAGAALGTRQN